MINDDVLWRLRQNDQSYNKQMQQISAIRVS